jgi:hypothetical protein
MIFELIGAFALLSVSYLYIKYRSVSNELTALEKELSSATPNLTFCNTLYDELVKKVDTSGQRKKLELLRVLLKIKNVANKYTIAE